MDIHEDGTVYVGGVGTSVEEAIERINLIVKEPEVGEVYDGRVVTIQPFGAFVRLFGNKDGLLHISRVATGRVERVRTCSPSATRSRSRSSRSTKRARSRSTVLISPRLRPERRTAVTVRRTTTAAALAGVRAAIPRIASAVPVVRATTGATAASPRRHHEGVSADIAIYERVRKQLRLRTLFDSFGDGAILSHLSR